MKKRAILTTVVAAMLAVCMFSLTACAGSVEGKTYKFHDITYKYDGEMTENEKIYADRAVETMKKIFESLELTFEEGGKVKSGSIPTGTWEQDGSKLVVKAVVGSGEYKLSGSKLIMSNKDDKDAKLTITVTLKAA